MIAPVHILGAIALSIPQITLRLGDEENCCEA